jgi:hypothetical protein
MAVGDGNVYAYSIAEPPTFSHETGCDINDGMQILPKDIL